LQFQRQLPSQLEPLPKLLPVAPAVPGSSLPDDTFSPMPRNWTFQQEMDNLPLELRQKIKAEAEPGILGRFEYWGTINNGRGLARQLTWDKVQKKIWISENAITAAQPSGGTISLRKLFPLPTKMFYVLDKAAAFGHKKWNKIAAAPAPPPEHYYFVYTKSGKSFKMFPILYKDSGDGPVVLMDPVDPTKFLNLFVPPLEEVYLLKPMSSFFLNGPTEWLVAVDV
jgi:hypothetical protein